MTVVDISTRAGCVAFLVDRRLACRFLVRHEDAIRDANLRDERLARKLRETKSPMLCRRADVLDFAVKKRREVGRELIEQLVELGEQLYSAADFIDELVPRDLLLDILNVNPADRAQIEDGDGFIKIVFVLGLEDSASHRNDDFKSSPLFRACQARFAEELLNNQKLKDSAHEILFGQGGIFEFLPRYREMPDGAMERLPPPLRVVNEHAHDGSRASRSSEGP